MRVILFIRRSIILFKTHYMVNIYQSTLRVARQRHYFLDLFAIPRRLRVHVVLQLYSRVLVLLLLYLVHESQFMR